MRNLAILATALLAAPLATQTYVYVPSDTPNTGGGNVIPFGTINTNATWVNQRYQTLVPASTLGTGGLTICSLAFACGTAHVKTWDYLKITMAQTTNTALDLTFANNLTSNVKVVFEGRNHVWPVAANQWDNIGLQKTFTYLPPFGNLVIEVIAMGNHRLDATGTVGFYSYAGARTYAFTWTGTPPTVASGGDVAAALKMRLGVAQPSVDVYGYRCGPGPLGIATTGNGQIGTTVTANLTGGPSSGVGLIWLGFNTAAPLPIDLTAAGFTGCWLQVPLDLVLGAVPFQGGTSTPMRLALPNDRSLACSQFGLQGLAIEPPAPRGVSISDWARVLMGL